MHIVRNKRSKLAFLSGLVHFWARSSAIVSRIVAYSPGRRDLPSASERPSLASSSPSPDKIPGFARLA